MGGTDLVRNAMTKAKFAAVEDELGVAASMPPSYLSAGMLPMRGGGRKWYAQQFWREGEGIGQLAAGKMVWHGKKISPPFGSATEVEGTLQMSYMN
jgi:hypothetical protein